MKTAMYGIQAKGRQWQSLNEFRSPAIGPSACTAVPPASRAKARKPAPLSTRCTVAAGLFAALLPQPSLALDGCTVLLCLAAPNWRSIEQCVPPMRQLFRDLLRGRPFPVCAMSGAGNTASNAWSTAPDFCPPQYTRAYDGPNGLVYTCDYSGMISVSVDGTPFTRTWWSPGGDAVTEFSPAAKARLGTWDKRFDEEFQAWLATQAAITQLQN